MAISVVVAFVAWGFATHWIPVIRYLGYAFATGCITVIVCFALFAILSVRPKGPVQATQRHSQTAAFVESARWIRDTDWQRRCARYNRKSILKSFVAAESIDELFDWVLRDFVASWYGNISSSPVFINEIDNAIRDVVIDVSDRLQQLDLVEIVVLRFVPIITRHLRDFYEAEQSVRGKNLTRKVTESEELDLAIAAKYCDGHLHPAASTAFSDTKMVQTEYLRKVVARLLPSLVPEELVQSRSVTVLIREIVSCAVLSPLIGLLCDPDTWNQALEAFGRTMLDDRKTVRKLRAALDTHASPAPKAQRTQAFPKLAPHDDDRKFERFIRAIRQCNNLSDARRFRNEVSSQLKRESMLEGQDQIYLRRLESGKRILDQRVGMLSAVGGSSDVQSNRMSNVSQKKSKMADAGILDILRDASGLSYFMEYMDRLHLMTLVQFWVVVDGFRNPLENDVYEDLGFIDGPRQWTESDRLDIAQISEAYLTRPELKIPQTAREAVQDFLKSHRSATMNQYHKARGAILRAQTAIQEELGERHLPNFRKSDLFYKLLTSDDVSAQATLQPRNPIDSREPRKSLEEAFLRAPHAPLPVSRVQSGLNNLKSSAKSSSSSDLKSILLGNQDESQRARRSLDVNVSGPLFDSEVEPDSAMRPRRSFDAQSSNGDQSAGMDAHMVEAIEAALSNIMTSDHHDEEVREPLFGDRGRTDDFSKDFGSESSVGNLEQTDMDLFGRKGKPDLVSLGLVETSSRIGFFRDNDLFGEEKFPEDEHVESDDSEGKDSEGDIQEAAPGDLGLAEAISALTVDIDKLVAQESIVDTLTRKAELTNNVAELRILSKSKSSLHREVRRKELQRQQYIVQESDNSLFGRATVHIKSIMVGKEEDGQEFALYVIEVNRQAGEHMPAASWAIARRYSEFHRLHQRLRQVYPIVRNLGFPRRRLVMKLQNEFLHRRRASLEHYLRELLRIPAVCRSFDLRAFLSQRPILSENDVRGDGARDDMVSRIYTSVTDGMDEFLGNIPVLDQLSVAGQNLISAATSQYYNNARAQDAQNSTQTDAIEIHEARTELDAFDNQTLEPIVKPICDLFLETFELNRAPNWLRGRAVVVVLHQLLGGTVERKIREVAKSYFTEDSLLKYITLVKDTLWPGGLLQKERKQRTEAEKRTSRREASVVLAALVPELAASVVGRSNAQAAGRRLFATFNNPRLNTHLVFLLLDEAIAVLFP